MPSIPGWIGPSAAHVSLALAPERTVNLYVEAVQGGQQKFALHSMPGLKRVATAVTTPLRGLWTASNGRVFLVANDTLFEVQSNWALTIRGTLAAGTSLASLTDNGLELFFSVDGNAYALTFADNDFDPVNPTEPETFGPVDTMDGYIFTIKPGTESFYWSNLRAARTWDALNFQHADAKPDPAVALLTDTSTLWVAGTQTVEVFYNTGNSLDLFRRIQGAVIEQGCVAPRTFTTVDNAKFWLGGTAKGQGPVWMVGQGYQPARVSTDALEQAIGTYSTITDAVAWTARVGGHAFYVLDFPTAGVTWCYDTVQGTWTELAGLTPQGAFGSYPVLTHTLAFGQHLFGDRSSGDLYVWDTNYHLYGDIPRVCMRTAPHLRREQMPVSYGSFTLVAQMGEYAAPEVAQTWPPLFRLTWSDDGGKSWCYEKTRPLGWLGEYGLAARWRQLGQARMQRSFRVLCDAPVRQTWSDALVEVS